MRARVSNVSQLRTKFFSKRQEHFRAKAQSRKEKQVFLLKFKGCGFSLRALRLCARQLFRFNRVRFNYTDSDGILHRDFAAGNGSLQSMGFATIECPLRLTGRAAESIMEQEEIKKLSPRWRQGRNGSPEF